MIFTSGNNARKTTPPAKIPTAILVRIYANKEIRDRTVLACGVNLRSKNSGIVKTLDRIKNGPITQPNTSRHHACNS
jgi:hypothetical protein